MADPPTTADRYRRFATLEACGHSPCYEQWALGLADDPSLLDLIDSLPVRKRQPNLVFGACRYVGVEPGPFEQFRAWLTDHWRHVESVSLKRSTQTNGAGRCAVLLPILADLPGPLALIEVGAAAGLCLYPDRFRYCYDRGVGSDAVWVGDPSAPVLPCAIRGPAPIPHDVPTVVWRAGIDLHPLSADNEDDVRWLRCLVWPEQEDRQARLDAAIGIARADPPLIIQGDLNGSIVSLVARAPAGTTIVVFHSAVLAYLSPDEREHFARTVQSLPVRWISNESPRATIATEGQTVPKPARDDARMVLALDGVPHALAGPHGQSLDWIA